MYEASREVRKETMSEWSTWACVFVAGIECPQCHVVHGPLLPIGEPEVRPVVRETFA
jgi:hypothetical protein